MRPGTVKRLFGTEGRDYYEDDNITITVIHTDDIERGNQVPPKNHMSSR